MFGYVRPVMDKLIQEDQDKFQSIYCGLCYELEAQYGILARFILNYDFTFLAILLSGQEEIYTDFRCPCKRFCRKKRVSSSQALEIAADESVILTYWKLEDEEADNKLFRRLGYRFLRFLATPVYRKAEKKRPLFAAAVEKNLKLLRQMEMDKVASIDRTADAFANLLAAAAEELDSEEKHLVHHQMFYHLGRWIYLVDALDDLKEDAQQGKYNPLIYRYELDNGLLDDDSRQKLIATLDHSVNLICSAYALADYGPWNGVVENIIYYGLPATGRLVLEGKWNINKGRKFCFKAGHGIEESERMEPGV